VLNVVEIIFSQHELKIINKIGMESVKEKQKKAYEALKDEFGYTNTMAAPKITKVVINSSTGSSKDRKRNDLLVDRLSKITGQRPALAAAKKSIATFKLREGDKIGVVATLRGERMLGFLDKLINVAIPRTRDFRGLDKKGIDEMGNYTMGIKENVIFPETSDEDLRDVFGMSVTIVTTAKSRDEAQVLLELIGFPFKK
jgi:large subunit ribosomal protein L5